MGRGGGGWRCTTYTRRALARTRHRYGNSLHTSPPRCRIAISPARNASHDETYAGAPPTSFSFNTLIRTSPPRPVTAVCDRRPSYRFPIRFTGISILFFYFFPFSLEEDGVCAHVGSNLVLFAFVPFDTTDAKTTMTDEWGYEEFNGRCSIKTFFISGV